MGGRGTYSAGCHNRMDEWLYIHMCICISICIMYVYILERNHGVSQIWQDLHPEMEDYIRQDILGWMPQPKKTEIKLETTMRIKQLTCEGEAVLVVMLETINRLQRGVEGGRRLRLKEGNEESPNEEEQWWWFGDKGRSQKKFRVAEMAMAQALSRLKKGEKLCYFQSQMSVCLFVYPNSLALLWHPIQLQNLLPPSL